MAKKKTHEEYVAQIEDKYGEDYKILGRYTTADKGIEVMYNECEFIREYTFDECRYKSVLFF